MSKSMDEKREAFIKAGTRKLGRFTQGEGLAAYDAWNAAVEARRVVNKMRIDQVIRFSKKINVLHEKQAKLVASLKEHKEFLKDLYCSAEIPKHSYQNYYEIRDAADKALND